MDRKWDVADIALAMLAYVLVLSLVVVTCWSIGSIRHDVEFIKRNLTTTTTTP